MSFNIEMDDIELKKLALELEQIENEILELGEIGKPIILSENLESKMAQMIQEYEENELNKKKKSSFKRVMRLAAVIMICMTASLGVLTINVDAFRIKLFDIIGKDHGEYMDVNFVEKGELSPQIKEKFPIEWNDVFYPMELPEGYKLVEAKSTGTLKLLMFSNKDKGEAKINLQYSPSGEWQQKIDSENADVAKAEVNGKDALYTAKDGFNILVWSDSGYEFTLYTDKLKIKETIKIAESMAYVNLN